MSYDREAVRPLVGTLWAWEPRKSWATALVEVTEVRWNGEEWWVKTRTLAFPADTRFPPGRAECWNALSRFWEACHRVSVNHGPAGHHPAAVRRGAPQPDERVAD